MKKYLFLLLFISILCSTNTFSHGITVNNVGITGQNADEDYQLIKLDLAWQNSWRTYNYESNWDAAWVFVKYRKLTETTWHHATLNYVDGTSANDGHIAPAGSTISTPSDGKGVFVYRENTSPTNFIGNVNYENMYLRWDYGADGLLDDDRVEIAVFAIEMVYVPEGAFYVGDGDDSERRLTFRDGDETSTIPFLIEGEMNLTLGGGSIGSLGRGNFAESSTERLNQDFNDEVTQLLPTQFPKGYGAFYCMKFEISQGQYAEFLKKLTSTQASLRYPNKYNETRFTIDPDFTCNAPDRACNYLTGMDGLAYADWAGLRPMTELEYEKACRGPNTPVLGELAWGTSIFRKVTVVVNDETPLETDGDNPRANAHIDQGLDVRTVPIPGPLRSGFTSGGSREDSGNSYYGISNLSDNLFERCVTVGLPEGRIFIGSHGDGILNDPGNATNEDWPGFGNDDISGDVGLGLRGGSFRLNERTATVSNRSISSYSYLNLRFEGREPYTDTGFRAVRTAE